MLKPDIHPQRQQLSPDGFHHLPQHVGADMGLMGIADVLRRAVGHKSVQHMADADVVDAGGELSVGEGARAPLAELHVRGLGERSGAPEVLHVSGTLIHIPAPLQHDGGQARPGQGKGGEQPGRSHPHHHGGVGKGAGGGGGLVGPFLPRSDPLGGAAEDAGLPPDRRLDRADQVDVLFFPRVDGLPGEGQLHNVLRADA